MSTMEMIAPGLPWGGQEQSSPLLTSLPQLEQPYPRLLPLAIAFCYGRFPILFVFDLLRSYNEKRKPCSPEDTLRDAAHDPTLRAAASVSRHCYGITPFDVFTIFTLCSILCQADKRSSYVSLDRDRGSDREIEICQLSLAESLL